MLWISNARIRISIVLHSNQFIYVKYKSKNKNFKHLEYFKKIPPFFLNYQRFKVCCKHLKTICRNIKLWQIMNVWMHAFLIRFFIETPFGGNFQHVDSIRRWFLCAKSLATRARTKNMANKWIESPWNGWKIACEWEKISLIVCVCVFFIFLCPIIRFFNRWTSALFITWDPIRWYANSA